MGLVTRHHFTTENTAYLASIAPTLRYEGVIWSRTMTTVNNAYSLLILSDFM